tara:strand:+ start:6505 stop:7488 length:984 start_codon:yes stop_codon:yes gene_type:complete
MSFMREEGAYRRGTILGLTFAEIMLLLLFVLLIALAYFLQHKEDEVRQARHDQQIAEKQLTDITSKFEALAGGKDFTQVIKDTFLELTLAKDTIQAQKEQIVALREEKAANDSVREKAEAWDRMAEGFEGNPSAEEIIEKVEAGANSRAVEAAVERSGLPSDPEALRQALEDLREYEKLAVDAVSQKAEAERLVDYWRRRAGLSNELPPCWINRETSQAEYIFDIAMSSKGLSVFPRPPNYRETEMAELPLEGVRYEVPTDVATFRQMFRPLYAWSEKKECRFFVRAFDKTEAHEKELFKRLLLTTEGFFYKYLVSDRSIEPGDVDG